MTPTTDTEAIAAAKRGAQAFQDEVLENLEFELNASISSESPFEETDVEATEVGVVISHWAGVSIELLRRGFIEESLSVLQTILAVLRDAQLSHGRLHKGTPLHQIGWTLHGVGRLAEAEKYFTSALVEDIFRDPDGFRNAPAAVTLRDSYGKGPSFFDRVADEVDQALSDARFAEIVRLDPSLLDVALGLNSSIGQGRFRLGLPYSRPIGKTLRAWQLNAGTSDEKGLRYEALISYLLQAGAGYEIRGRVRTLDAEHDLILRDPEHRDSVLGEYLLVECKNLSEPAGAAIVRQFVQNIRSASCQSGILVSRGGVSGLSQNTDGWYAIRKWYHRDGVIVIALTDDDIEALVEQETSVRELLLLRYEQIRFDEAVAT